MSMSQEQTVSKKYQIKRMKNNLVELSFDNVARVEAMIYENSYYKNNKPSSSRSMIKNLTEESYNELIGQIVDAVDKENSTHLNSDKCGRTNVTARLQKYTFSELKELLKNENGEFVLLNEIAFSNDTEEKDHFSFATKLCHNLCMELLQGTPYEDGYCKYDTVLEKALPLYYKEYCGKVIKPSNYRKQYSTYIKYVDEIRQAAQEHHGGNKISRNGFDHLIWYCHKG